MVLRGLVVAFTLAGLMAAALATHIVEDDEPEWSGSTNLSLEDLPAGFTKLSPKEQELLDMVGWAKATGNKAKDVTKAYKKEYKRFNSFFGDKDLPKGAKKYHYMFLPGLFTKHYPFYGDCIVSALERKDLNVTRFEVDTDRTSEHNAPLIRDQILEAVVNFSKPIIVISHSKGSVDFTDAVSMFTKDIARYVKGHVALQPAFGGSTLASELTLQEAGEDALRKAVKAILKGDPEALLSMTYSRRQDFLKETPYPSGAVPTVALASWTNRTVSLVAPVSGLMHYKFGKELETDGLVTTDDAIIPGSLYVRIGDIDHADPVFDQASFASYKARPSVLSLLSLLLRDISHRQAAVVV